LDAYPNDHRGQVGFKLPCAFRGYDQLMSVQMSNFIYFRQQIANITNFMKIPELEKDKCNAWVINLFLDNKIFKKCAHLSCPDVHPS
jgi:hypothetical protein